MNTVIIAIVMGIMYWWCRGMILSYFGFLVISSPVTVGLVAGLLMGEPIQGLIIGGGIALVFAGIIAPGGNLPTDECLAATCVIPIAIGSGMSATTAIALAVPIGLLGSFVTNLRKIINTYFVSKANDYAEKGDTKGIWRCATLYPAIFAIPLLFLPVFIINMVGQDVVVNVMNALPEFVTHGLEVAGGVLPALGFALIMNMIGKRKADSVCNSWLYRSGSRRSELPDSRNHRNLYRIYLCVPEERNYGGGKRKLSNTETTKAPEDKKLSDAERPQ